MSIPGGEGLRYWTGSTTSESKVTDRTKIKSNKKDREVNLLFEERINEIQNFGRGIKSIKRAGRKEGRERELSHVQAGEWKEARASWG